MLARTIDLNVLAAARLVESRTRKFDLAGRAGYLFSPGLSGCLP